jgi:pimeloyl-ACP methyl ester carboxylesterase
MNRARHRDNKLSVVFLHGMFGAPENWHTAQDELSAQCEVRAPKLPIFHTPTQCDPVDFIVQTVRGYMCDRRIERVVLVGNSLGGHVAVRLALLEPERIAGLVLSGSSGLFERGWGKNVPRRPSREWLRKKISEVFFDPAHITEKMIDEVAAVVDDRRSALQLVRLAQSAKRDNLAALLPQVTLPTLLVWGENDQITPLTTAWQFYELLSNSELQTIPSCGHAPMLEQPRMFNEYLARFLSRCGNSGNILPIPQCAEQEQSHTHASEDRDVPAEVREVAAA